MYSILQDTIVNLQLAGYSPRTVEAYSYHVKKFLDYFDKAAAHITEDEIKQYFLYLKYKKKLSGSASAQAISGIKFMFEKTLNKDFKVFGIVKNPRGKKLPVVSCCADPRRSTLCSNTCTCIKAPRMSELDLLLRTQVA